MNKAELVEAIAKDTGLTKTDSEAALNAVVANVVKGAKKDGVSLVGFGTFRVVKTKARNGVNPQTGAKIKIPSKKALKFKASKTLAL
ncbi:MAG: HU family DNA-binding protein [Candidatus Woesearchaeota archaeon]